MKQKIKNERAITLIALVITIIVLLILAGVAISMLSGENGILRQATKAKQETEMKSAEEEIKLAVMAAIAEGEGKLKGDNAFEMLNTELSKIEGYVKNGDINELPATVKIGNKEYTINENGTIELATDTDIDADDTIDKFPTLPTIKAGEYASEKSKYIDSNKQVAVIPEGFTVSNVKTDTVDETTIKSGLVIYKGDLSKETNMASKKETNDQFVWVPVENAVYDSANENSSKIPTSETEGTLTEYTYSPMAINVDGNYKGLLYNYDSTGGAYLMYPSATNYQGTVNENREPDILTDNTEYGGDANTNGINALSSIVGIEGDVKTAEGKNQILDTWSKQLQNEYNEMVESVEEYGGFYVGRYETSLNTTTKNAEVKSGAQVATGAEDSANTWYGLYQKQKEYSSKNNLTNIVGSTMIWGSQYDQMMIWMQKNEIDVTGDIGDNRNLGFDVMGLGTTGTTETDVINNIYDIYGNGNELTLESERTDCRVCRGGTTIDIFPPVLRAASGMPWDPSSVKVSRTALYIK